MSRLHEADSRKRVAFKRQIAVAVDAHRAFFERGFRALAELEPFVRQVVARCDAEAEACADDATWYKKKASQNCRWVVEGDGLERCEEKSAADGAYAYEACRFACRSCDATVCGA